MNKGPQSITADTLAFDAMKLMENRDRPLNVLPVMDGDSFIGLLRLHDLLKQGFAKLKE